MSDLLDVPVAASRMASPVIRAEWHRGKRPANAGKKYPAEVLSPDEIVRLMAACPRRGPSGARNRALIAVMWRAGLRVSETVALRLADVDAEGRTIAVLCGKGAKRR